MEQEMTDMEHVKKSSEKGKPKNPDVVFNEAVVTFGELCETFVQSIDENRIMKKNYADLQEKSEELLKLNTEMEDEAVQASKKLDALEALCRELQSRFGDKKIEELELKVRSLEEDVALWQAKCEAATRRLTEVEDEKATFDRASATRLVEIEQLFKDLQSQFDGLRSEITGESGDSASDVQVVPNTDCLTIQTSSPVQPNIIPETPVESPQKQEPEGEEPTAPDDGLQGAETQKGYSPKLTRSKKKRNRKIRSKNLSFLNF